MKKGSSPAPGARDKEAHTAGAAILPGEQGREVNRDPNGQMLGQNTQLSRGRCSRASAGEAGTNKSQDSRRHREVWLVVGMEMAPTGSWI